MRQQLFKMVRIFYVAGFQICNVTFKILIQVFPIIFCMFLFQKIFKDFGMLKVAKRHNLLSETKLLIGPLSALIILRLLD